MALGGILRETDILNKENLIITIYGPPGLGKTTTAMTASNPLLLDFEGGIHRAAYRKAVKPIEDWREILEINANDLKEFDTIIIDTAGACIQSIFRSLVHEKRSFATMHGAPAVNSYSPMGAIWSTFVSTLRSYKKNIIFIAHSKEEKKKEEIVQRIVMDGKSPLQVVMQCSDMIGYLHLINNKPVLSFDPTDDHFAKNPWRIAPLELPDIKTNKHYLADIIQEALHRLNTPTTAQVNAQANFEAAKALIENAKTPQDFTDLVLNTAIINTPILKGILHKTATNEPFNYIFDKVDFCYKSTTPTVVAETEPDLISEEQDNV